MGITRILRRNGVPRLHDCDPLTGELIRASKTTAIRYERDRPGELVHVDVNEFPLSKWLPQLNDVRVSTPWQSWSPSGDSP